MAEDAHNRRKFLEDLEEEQNRLNKLMRYEFKDIMNEETPIVLINQDEIDQLKRNDYYNNIIMNERKEVQRKKSQEENISPYKNNIQSYNANSTSPFGSTNNVNNKYMNNSILNNSKNINTSMRNSNIGIGGIGGINYANYNNLNKMNSGVIEENIDNENISSSQKSKEKKSGNYNNYNNTNNININNINTLNNNIQRTSLTTKLPPINQNPNQTAYSIKEEIDLSGSKSRSKIATTSKKSNDGMNDINLNNINNNNLFNNNRTNKFNNINYDNNKNDEDEYGDGDFENNISSLNQNSEFNTAKKSVNFGRIKNQNEASMSVQEKMDKQSRLGYNDKESSDSYNDFENTRGLIKKGINFEGSGNFNNVSKFKNNKNINTQESEIKEEIEYGEM